MSYGIILGNAVSQVRKAIDCNLEIGLIQQITALVAVSGPPLILFTIYFVGVQSTKIGLLLTGVSTMTRILERSRDSVGGIRELF